MSCPKYSATKVVRYGAEAATKRRSSERDNGWYIWSPRTRDTMLTSPADSPCGNFGALFHARIISFPSVMPGDHSWEGRHLRSHHLFSFIKISLLAVADSHCFVFVYLFLLVRLGTIREFPESCWLFWNMHNFERHNFPFLKKYQFIEASFKNLTL